MMNVIETICTARVNPGDERSPLKYGKLRKLNFDHTNITDAEIKLLVENLTELILDARRPEGAGSLTRPSLLSLRPNVQIQLTPPPPFPI